VHYCQAKAPLGRIVCKRNPQGIEQRQYLLGAQKQRIQQILSLALVLLAPDFSRSYLRRGWWRLSGIASQQDLEMASNPFVALNGGNSTQVEQAPLLQGCFRDVSATDRR
jgi:hypothetical protein